jgi:hypothetical protein
MNNMTPREKANELYSKYDDLLNKDFGNPIVFDNQLKQCALIAVDEILKYFKYSGIDSNLYWANVKHEIEKLIRLYIILYKNSKKHTKCILYYTQ